MDRERRRRWPESRAAGCLLWLLILAVLIVILSLLFGGFQKGTKADGAVPVVTVGLEFAPSPPPTRWT